MELYRYDTRTKFDKLLVVINIQLCTVGLEFIDDGF